MKLGPKTPASVKSRRCAQALGLALLVLFFLGQSMAVWHHAFVSHTVCHVDGEIAHGDAHDHGDDAHASDEAPTHVDGPVLLAGGEGDEHDDHCSFPETRDPRKHPQHEAPPRIEPDRSVARVTCAPTEVVVPSNPVYRLAPKQSPPRFV